MNLRSKTRTNTSVTKKTDIYHISAATWKQVAAYSYIHLQFRLRYCYALCLLTHYSSLSEKYCPSKCLFFYSPRATHTIYLWCINQNKIGRQSKSNSIDNSSYLRYLRKVNTDKSTPYYIIATSIKSIFQNALVLSCPTNSYLYLSCLTYLITLLPLNADS